MTVATITAAEQARAYRALMDGIGVVEDRIAPLWTTPAAALSERRRTVRARVTANGFRELDVLLAHWVGIVARRPVRMTEIDDWREGDAAGDSADGGFTKADILRIAAEYRHAVPHPAGLMTCELAA